MHRPEPLQPAWVDWDPDRGRVSQLWPGDLVTYLWNRGEGLSAADGLGLVISVRDETAWVLWLDSPPNPYCDPVHTVLTWMVRVINRPAGDPPLFFPGDG